MYIYTYTYIQHRSLHLVSHPGLQSTPLDPHRDTVVVVVDTSGIQPPDLRPGQDVSSCCSVTLEDGPCLTNAIPNANASQREPGPTRFRRAPQMSDPITPLQLTKEGSQRRITPFNSIPFHSEHKTTKHIPTHSCHAVSPLPE